MDKIIGQRILDLTEPNKLSYTTQPDVLPGHHVYVLNDASSEKNATADNRDYAFFCLDTEGRVVSWYSGAERIYGYKSDEIVGRLSSCLYLDAEDDQPRVDFEDELKKTAAGGHSGNEGWHKKKDGSRFWANSLTTAFRDRSMELQGFARVVRDFSTRHRLDEALLSKRAGARQLPVTN